MLDKQNGMCAICQTAPAAHVDHDHETGAVRALLCFNCNGGLGQFRDDPAVLRAAADYVEEHQRRRKRSHPMLVHRSQVTARPATRRTGLRLRRVSYRDLTCDRGRARLVELLREA
jgi:hypothetical protein